MSTQIIVTGSRDWTDVLVMSEALSWALNEYPSFGAVLKHGGCPEGGADWVADWAWRQLPPNLEIVRSPLVFDAKDFDSFKARNQAMVDSGASVCLAFATAWASGTGQTARMARRAGIRTVDIGVSTV